MKTISKKYVFKPYDPIFPLLFKSEKRRIEKVIGRAYRIEHMGSTAVPELGGKGIIDIYLAAPFSDLKILSKKVQKIGYEFRPDAGADSRLFHFVDLSDQKEGIRRYHLHIVARDSADFINSLLFRDFLRAHPDSIKKYAEIKKYAASIAGENKLIYMSTKEGVIKEIMYAAFYDTVKKIPQGKVATYGQLAKICGLRSPRLVGYLLHQNPDPKNIPCHRVVNRDGRLAKNFAFGGVDGQADKLNTEGVIVNDSKVDLEKYLWESD